MTIEPVYFSCSARCAYYVSSRGEAAIIGPQPHVQDFIDRATSEGARISFIFETSLKSGSLSGAAELSEKTGAPVVYGPNASPAFPAIVAADGEKFRIGDVTIEVIHTPGHTPESACLLVHDEKGRAKALFTGDTLYTDKTGTPHLVQKPGTANAETLAGLLFDSIEKKLAGLPEQVIVCPSSGLGDSCTIHRKGKTHTTIGALKASGVLVPGNKESFIRSASGEKGNHAGYFRMLTILGHENPGFPGNMKHNAERAFSAGEFACVANITGAIVIDTRPAWYFARGHVPRSVNIGADGNFAHWARSIIRDFDAPLLLISEPGQEQTCISTLKQAGFRNISGFLQNGFDTWLNAGMETDTVTRITGKEFARRVNPDDLVIDVRDEKDFLSGHLEMALNMPLKEINVWSHRLDTCKPFYLHCALGYGSMMAASILKSRGIHHFSEIDGGFLSISATTLPKWKYPAPVPPPSSLVIIKRSE